MSLFLVYCPYPTKENAKEAGKRAIIEGLAACVNIFACDSIYVWQGNFEESAEHVAIFKATDEKLSVLCDFIKATHPYAVPSVITIEPHSINSEYLAWAEGNCANRV